MERYKLTLPDVRLSHVGVEDLSGYIEIETDAVDQADAVAKFTALLSTGLSNPVVTIAGMPV